MYVPLEHDYIGLSEASSMEKPSESCSLSSVTSDISSLLNLKATELRLGLPGLSKENPSKNSPTKGFVSGAKRGFSDVDGSGKWGLTGGLEGKQTQQSNPHLAEEKKKENCRNHNAQVVGWPPIRSFRKNTMTTNVSKNGEVAEGKSGCLYVKVSMDGAPYLRKVDLKNCKNYTILSKALEKMFGCLTIGQCSSNGLRGTEGLCESNLKDLLKRNECVLTYEDKDGDWMLVGDVPWEMFVDSCKRLRIMKGSEAIGLAPRSMEKCKNQIRGI